MTALTPEKLTRELLSLNDDDLYWKWKWTKEDRMKQIRDLLEGDPALGEVEIESSWFCWLNFIKNPTKRLLRRIQAIAGLEAEILLSHNCKEFSLAKDQGAIRYPVTSQKEWDDAINWETICEGLNNDILFDRLRFDVRPDFANLLYNEGILTIFPASDYDSMDPGPAMYGGWIDPNQEPVVVALALSFILSEKKIISSRNPKKAVG